MAIEYDPPPAILDLLFGQWIYMISQRELGVNQYGSAPGRWEFFRQPAGDIFALEWTGSPPRWYADVGQGFNESDIVSVISRAVDAVVARDFGDSSWYRAVLISDMPDVITLHAQLMRNLGQQVSAVGWFK